MSAYADELFLPQAAMADEFAAIAMGAVSGLPAGSRVLDIGCGSGDLIRRATRPGIELVGVDISRPNIEVAQATCPDAKFYCEDFLTFNAGQFDAAFANSILHLIDCPDTVLTSALARSIEPGGTLVASMPSDSVKNRLLSGQRSIWRTLPMAADNLAVWMASFFTSQTDPLKKRLIYLRMPPTRLHGRCFTTAMERDGFRLERTIASKARHPLKLDHVIATWRRY